MAKRPKKKKWSTYDTVSTIIAGIIFVGTLIVIWPITPNPNIVGLLFALISVGVFTILVRVCDKACEEKMPLLFTQSLFVLIFIGIFINTLTGLGFISFGAGMITSISLLIVTLSLGIMLIFLAWPSKSKLIRGVLFAAVALGTVTALWALMIIAQTVL